MMMMLTTTRMTIIFKDLIAKFRIILPEGFLCFSCFLFLLPSFIPYSLHPSLLGLFYLSLHSLSFPVLFLSSPPFKRVFHCVKQVSFDLVAHLLLSIKSYDGRRVPPQNTSLMLRKVVLKFTALLTFMGFFVIFLF